MELLRKASQVLLGAVLAYAGIIHLTSGRAEFQAQVPTVFPGNISQYVNSTDAFELNSDRARAVRLLFQPLLVVWALWSTGAWVYFKQLGRPKLL